jgi:hypothetical protein
MSNYKQFQLFALAFATAVLFGAVLRGGPLSQSELIECSTAPNGKLYLAPGC